MALVFELQTRVVRGRALARNRTRVNCLEGSYAHHYTTNTLSAVIPSLVTES
ncbi:integrin-linked kinase-associated serine/threonine phosphatase 2C, partial [Tachysurus ichikawai]